MVLFQMKTNGKERSLGVINSEVILNLLNVSVILGKVLCNCYSVIPIKSTIRSNLNVICKKDYLFSIY